MNLVFPRFELSPGTLTCLHIPHGFHEAAKSLEHQLIQLAARSSKAISIARPAGFEAGTERLSDAETSAGWLSRVAGISEQAARQAIADLGVKVAERVASPSVEIAFKP